MIFLFIGFFGIVGKVHESEKSSKCNSDLFEFVAFSALASAQDEFVCGSPRLSGATSIDDVTNDAYIVGGSDATPGFLPWTLRIEITDDGETFELLCGAALIDPRFALTAARCVEDMQKCEGLPVVSSIYFFHRFRVF